MSAHRIDPGIGFPRPEPERAGIMPASGELHLGRGEALPLGVHECRDGINLAVFSRHATRMALLIFAEATDERRRSRIELDPQLHRTGDVWHCSLRGAPVNLAYVFQADGPRVPAAGHRFDPDRLLLDPYAPVVTGLASGSSRGVAADQGFDWQGTEPPRHPWRRTVLYETHVRGLTVHSSSGARNAGGYLGVIDKIPYLKGLGITAVELMPVQAFEPGLLPRSNPTTGERLVDYWGYNPVALFAPAAHFAGGSALDAALTEFKTMVRELHRAGIEVILDVVFNHTAEGNERGPTFSFRGLDNAIYYMLGPDGRYLDFTGCGNTVNCNHPVVRGLVIDCLRHWVMHCRVDGFRFDLASVLGRDPAGSLLPNPPLLEQIAEDPVLRDVKLIAEAWDASGAFQVGSFPGRRWAEWNAHFRDDVRRFWRGDPGMTGRFASRLAGSADLYERGGESPVNSINFITSHDGLTLNDLVSYAVKHNEANGEDNRDGSNANWSENNGVEGPTEDPAIDAVRIRQIKNLLAILFLSRGVPMLLGGDEFRRSQAGNNNAYCQDNEISWYDWCLAERNVGLVRFVKGLAALRAAHPVLSEERFYRAEDIVWLGENGQPPDWDGGENRLGCLIWDRDGGALCLLFNAMRGPCSFVLPAAPQGNWRILVDTAKAAPADSAAPGNEPLVSLGTEWVTLQPRSTVVLLCVKPEPSRNKRVIAEGGVDARGS
jgi:isoamylase